jgi:HSP20 family molecular chaperone IbpA
MPDRNNQGNTLARRPQGTLARQPGGELLSRWDPWSDMTDMNRRMDALFNRFFGFGLPEMWGPQGQNLSGMGTEGQEPEVDIYETDKEYTLQAALPGVNQNDMHIEATENSIRLTAESHWGSEMQPSQGSSQQAGASQSGQQPAPQGGTPGSSTQPSGTQPPAQPPIQHRQSRYSRQSRFQFAYTLPEEIDPNAVRANFRNGMLELHLPKAQPQTSQSVSVPITAGEEGAQNPPAVSSPPTQPGTTPQKPG